MLYILDNLMKIKKKKENEYKLIQKLHLQDNLQKIKEKQNQKIMKVYVKIKSKN